MTKRLKLAVFLLFGLAAALGAQEKLASRVARVTVFADRALVTRRAEVSLFRGETVFLVTDLPAEVDPASVQISGAGAFTLRDVRVSAHQKTRDVSEQLRSLENEKRALEDQAAAVNDRIREAEAERGFLAEIAKRLTVHVGPSEALPLDPAAWTGMLDFHRLRNAAVNETVRVSRREVQGLQAEIDRVSREISGLGSVSRLSVTEVVLVVDAPAPIKAVLEISYLVTGPSWRPNYVLRAAFASSRVAVHYRALVRQNTGEGWEGAVLSLSTARPQAGGSVPILPPWHLDIPRAVPVLQRADVKETLASPAARGTVLGESLADQEQAAPAMRIDSALASAGATAVTFEVPGPTTVASDNRDRTLTIAVLDLPAVFSHAAVPRLSPFAYLLAEVTNDSVFPFLAGPTQIYVDGSYVADAAIQAVPPGGVFRADLGIDEGVQVERVSRRRFDENIGALGRRTRTTREYEIRVRNAKRSEVTLEVSDQIPVSLNEQIVVRSLAPAYTRDTESLRKLENDTFVWTLRLAPGRDAVLPLSFSVEYPRGMPIIGLD